MVEIRTNCENCNKDLPPNSQEAMICGFECTFCATCVDDILQNVCPNCGGGFEKRPVMPKQYLAKNPPRADRVFKPVDFETYKELQERNKDVPPHLR